MNRSVIPDISIRSQRPARRSPERGSAIGRYDGRTHNTRAPAAGLGKPVKSANSDTVVAAVADPWGNGKERVLATVNRRTDLLELERSHGRISEAAYRAGRTVQDVLEKAGRIGGSKWDLTPSHHSTMENGAVARAMERAQAAVKMVAFVQGRLGMIDTRLLRRVLGDRMGYADIAALQGKSGEKGATYVARRFRDALEDLAEAFAARGKAAPAADDKHAAAAREAAEREGSAVAGGGTLRPRRR